MSHVSLDRLQFPERRGDRRDWNGSRSAHLHEHPPSQEWIRSFALLGTSIVKRSLLADKAMQVDEKKRIPVESEIIRVANDLCLYLRVMNGFLFASPHSDFRVQECAKRVSSAWWYVAWRMARDKGTGLGLYVCGNIVNWYWGGIALKGRPGGNTLWKNRFPGAIMMVLMSRSGFRDTISCPYSSHYPSAFPG